MAMHRVTAATVGLALILLVSTWVSFAMAESDKDIAECTEQLAGMATCLPYVQGEAKAPTPDCCGSLKQVLKNSSKCLCVIIKDRNDPDLGLNVNVTLALRLPSVCHAPANVSRCPALLNLPPNSPDAQVFYQFAKSLNHGGADSPSPAPIRGNTTQQQMSASGGGSSVGLIKRGSVWMLVIFPLWALLLWHFD